ncbi:MAG TPA: xanthine dehydrogenase family protein molybdopterin-binding subunit [Xanthobacteraceae bacterium]|jgi:carbon-monoxide dehydrogenase large subunit|nr:xanthine dehydrogenase family protein molybdopterin-binding subunit [Xanthobacteraceae bacterium]
MDKKNGREPYIGRPLPRLEDLRLVAGRGRFTDDFTFDNQAYAGFVRSPHPHAHLVSIDTKAAAQLPGVIAVFTANDYAAAGGRGIAHVANPASTYDVKIKAFTGPGRQTPFETPHLPLAADRVRFVGEPVALVIAETQAAAQDGAESVVVRYEVLPAVTDSVAALAPDAPQLHDGLPGNLAIDTAFGDQAACDAAFAAAHLILAKTFRNQRIASAHMEPRAAIGAYNEQDGVYTILTGSQGAVRIKSTIAACLGVPPERVRAITHDVGGAFGLLSNVYPEQVMVTWAARQLGRPVKWTGDRSQAFLADYQGRDLVTDARLALAADGKILALAIEMTGNIGAHPVTYVPLSNAYRVTPTVYDIPVATVAIRGALTNTAPTAPFRGAGRPEATFVIERLLDIAARRLGIDRITLRRRNLIRRAQLPYKSATGLVYDSGDFRANMDAAAKLADWEGFAGRRREARRRGRLAGIGLANYVECPVGMPSEYVRVTVRETSKVEAIAGTQSSGQGHETTFAQVLADQLGITPEQVKLVTGDTAVVPAGGGSHSDRSMRLAGTLLVEASGRIIEQARRVFAAVARCAESDVSFDGAFFESPRSNRRLDIFDIAHAVATDETLPPELRAPLTGEAGFSGRIPAYPTGAAVCEVEIDPETGAMELRRYSSIDDCGQPINPLILHGQVHGGIVQGAGQALLECFTHNPASGQVLTGSFMDYAMPRADMAPSFRVELAEDATKSNPLRVKGGGEAGITPALAAIMNAVVDALSVYGIEHIDMPATPARVWAAIRAATRKAGSG